MVALAVPCDDVSAHALFFVLGAVLRGPADAGGTRLGGQHGLRASGIESGVLRAPAVLDASAQCSRCEVTLGVGELRRC